MAFQAPRGTHDVLPGEAPAGRDADSRLFHTYKWQALEATFREVCSRFGVEEIRTPIFEDTALFHRSVGEATDIVAKETYDLEDRGGDSLTLRPEGTAGVMRAIVQHGLAGGQNVLLRLYYLNSHFRYERPQRGRYRQHHQVGVEYVGADDPMADVEVIALGMTYLREVGLDDVRLEINSVGTPTCRPVHREALRDHLRPHLAAMSEDSQRRFETNPLRILDSKDPRDQEFIEGAPAMIDYLDDEAAEHFAKVQAGLANLGIPFVVNRRLVRGLDYYQKTAFEVVHTALGSQNVVLGGGRYDGLLSALGGPAVGGVGFGSGVERALLILEQLERPIGARKLAQVYLVAREAGERATAQRVASELRAAGLRVDYDLQGRSQKAQLRAANNAGCGHVVFVRDDLPAGWVQLKNMADGEQAELAIADLATRLTTVYLSR
ncbi:MAG: histidine--tRNA ligase [Armatimonadetes bacterium]|nr:histidine--tRNA ligase [Armatimonadota bacterium]